MSITALFAVIGRLFSAFAGSTFGSFVLRTGASLVLSQIAASLSSPPVRDDQSSAAAKERTTSLDGNVLASGAPIPRVLGSQRVFPPLLAQPLYYYVDGREVVEGVYALAGPHDLDDIYINGAPIDGVSGIEVVTDTGTHSNRGQTLVRRYGYTEQAQSDLSGHLVESDGVTIDISGGDISAARPQAQIYRKVSRADEFWLHVMFASGLHREASATDPVRVPFRVRIRPVGGEWRNLPEVHFRGRKYDAQRATIRLIWRTVAPVAEAVAGDGFALTFLNVPAQVGGSEGGWSADATFDAGAGDNWLDSNNAGTTRLRRVQTDPFEVRYYLDPAEFVPGEWDVEIMRGAPIMDALMVRSTYAYSGVVRDLFGWLGTPATLPEPTGPIQDACTLVRAVSVVNQTPTPSRDVAVIALRARGVAVQRLSVMAHGLVRAWGDNLASDGYAPADWSATGGAVVTADPETWLSRYDAAAQVASGGSVDDAAQGLTAVSVAAGAHRCRALVVAGEGARARLGVVDGGVPRSVIFDLAAGSILSSVNVGGGGAGKAYVREVAVGVHEIGFDIWSSAARDVSLSVGPASATSGAHITVLMGEIAEAWGPLQRSDNPADLFRDVLLSRAWSDPFLPGDLDEAAILDWHDRCRRNGYRCRTVIEDTTIAEVLRIICGAGYARPAMLRGSIVQDYDRRGERAVHIFTPRNSAQLSWQKATINLPTGLRVVYRDENAEQQEITVLADGENSPGRSLEQVEYESIQTAAEGIARARYDMRSAQHRRAVYGLTAPPAQLALLPGSVVELVTDEFSDIMAAGAIRLTQVAAIGVSDDDEAYYITRGGDDLAFYSLVVQPVLDGSFESIGAPGWGDAEVMADLGDMRRAGLVLEVYVQGDDGLWTSYLAEPFEGRTNVLLIDAPDGALRHGAEAAIIVSGQPERMIVAEIAPNADQSAQIVLMPDASAEIWGAA